MPNQSYMEIVTGGQARDAFRNRIDGGTAIQTQDGGTGGNLKVSPIAVSSTVLEIRIPDNAVKMTMLAITDAVRYGDNDTLTGTAGTVPDGDGWSLLLVNTTITIPVSNRNSVYVLRNSSDAVLHFHFDMCEASA